MSSKHIFNDSDNLVLRSLRGAVILNPALRLHAATKTVYVSCEAAESSKARVSIISGGGAGHEPAHASYTGLGMLRSSVSGDIFASPSASQIRTAIDLALAVTPAPHNGCREVLLVVNNYTGDRLNFGLAAETARSRGIDVAIVNVADDVAIGRTPLGLVGRRGLAGNILVCKILGAAAERGLPLCDVVALGNALTANLASIGLSLDHCHVPGKGKKVGDWEKLDEEACELGLGLHNEKGVKRLRATPEPQEMISMMLKPLLDTDDAERSFTTFKSDEESVLFLNNLGGLSQLEMGAVVHEVYKQLASLNINPCRVYSAAYMTSLNAPGFSISLLNVSSANRAWQDAQNPVSFTIPELLDDQTDALAWTGVRCHWSRPELRSLRDLEQEERQAEELVHTLQTEIATPPAYEKNTIDPAFTMAIIRSAALAVLQVEAELSHFDTVCGDGDCGLTFAAGATATLQGVNSLAIHLGSAPSIALDLARILEGSMGGTSGALFSLYFTSLSTSLQSLSWRDACFQALQALATYTPAQPGDRTLVDALEPFCAALRDGKSLAVAAAAARKGAESTKGMVPKLGRAVYVGTGEGQHNVPDPGAWGIMVIAEGMAVAADK